MTMKKIALPAVLLMTLTACMDGGGSVNKAPSGVNSCANLTGMSAEYLQGQDVRCGPQTQLPYTLN